MDIYVKLFLKIEKPSLNDNPSKILFIVLAQLGDTLIMSYVFPLIKARFPNSSIDVLCGEWSRPILEKNPYINNIIFFNHLRMNRSKDTIWTKMKNHSKTSRSALNFIRRQKYDVSIEGGVTHPNGNILSYRGNVKRRIGFGSGGFGSLLTDEMNFPKQENFHIMEAVLGELRLLGIDKTLEDIKPYFNIGENSGVHILSKKNLLDLNKPFMIIHPESGNINHMMGNTFWEEITRGILNSSDYFIVICGIFNETSILAEYLSKNIGGLENRVVSAVQKLSLNEFYLLSCKAAGALTVDSLAAHLCSINCRTLSFYKNGYGRYFFPISGKKSTVVHNHIPSKKVFGIPNCNYIYVSDFELEETYTIIEIFLRELND